MTRNVSVFCCLVNVLSKTERKGRMWKGEYFFSRFLDLTTARNSVNGRPRVPGANFGGIFGTRSTRSANGIPVHAAWYWASSRWHFPFSSGCHGIKSGSTSPRTWFPVSNPPIMQLHIYRFSSACPNMKLQSVCHVFVPDFIPFISLDKINKKMTSNVQSKGHDSEA